VRPLGMFYSSYQYAFLQPEARILTGHKPERQAFLRRLFSCGKRGHKWTTLSPDEAAAEMEEPRERIMKALTWLEEAGDIQMKPSGARQRYRLCGDASLRDPEQVAVKMQALFAERETRDVQRLQQILELASQRECITRWLLRYFGEEMPADCGTCTSCKEREKGVDMSQPRPIPQAARPSITTEDVAVIRDLMDERHAALRTPRQLTRFLCGISSPATSRSRLTRLGTFGMLEQVAFDDVLAQAETMR
jgi:ATP-dependent DNA helicase RecQ